MAQFVVLHLMFLAGSDGGFQIVGVTEASLFGSVVLTAALVNNFPIVGGAL